MENFKCEAITGILSTASNSIDLYSVSDDDNLYKRSPQTHQNNTVIQFNQRAVRETQRLHFIDYIRIKLWFL